MRLKMTETKTDISERQEQQGDKNSSITMALIEHASRPIANVLIAIVVFLFLFIMKDSFLGILNRTNELRVGELLFIKAEGQGVSKELVRLSSLSTEQIQLFLIIGTRRPGSYITYTGPESKKENYEKLEKAGLIENIIIEKDPETGKETDLSWRNTAEGERLHQLLMWEIIGAIEQAKGA